jgi:hypothetical protein
MNGSLVITQSHSNKINSNQLEESLDLKMLSQQRRWKKEEKRERERER